MNDYKKDSNGKFAGMSIDQAKQWALPFGKYKGQLISDVFLEDESYIDWLHEQLKPEDNLKLAIELVCYTKDD